MAEQTDIFEMMMRADQAPHAHGDTYDASMDRLRLASILGCCHRAMLNGKRWTLFELARHCERELGRRVSETTVSAKLRDFRQLYGLEVPKERVGTSGTWWYWLSSEDIRKSRAA